MSETDTTMKHPSDQSMIENSTLFALNDDCLIELFQRLELFDYVNLALAYPQLQKVVDDFSARKHTKGCVLCLGYVDCPHFKASPSFENFSTALSVIGKHILDFQIVYSDRPSKKLILELFREKCKKLNSITFVTGHGAPELHGFPNLKELHMIDCNISNIEWRKYFINNPNLETMEYERFHYEEGFLEVLTLLPKLKSLVLPWLGPSFDREEEFDHLLCFEKLTKLTFRSLRMSNEILMKLAKLKLVELEVRMQFNANSIRILNSFRYLEVLSMVDMNRSAESPWYSDATVFPPQLKSFKFQGELSPKIPCSSFLSIVNHLKFLEQFEVRWGTIHWDNNKSTDLKDAKVISRIDNDLQQHQRTLKIVHWDKGNKDSEYTYRSHHLKIVNGFFTEKQATPKLHWAIRFAP